MSLPSFALYLVVLPHIYGYASSPRLLDLLVLAIPFILAVSMLGQFAGALAKRRETSVILLMGIGMPLFFLVGVAWPPEAIPSVLRLAIILTESQLAALEKAKAEKEAHGEFESECPTCSTAPSSAAT